MNSIPFINRNRTKLCIVFLILSFGLVIVLVWQGVQNFQLALILMSLLHH